MMKFDIPARLLFTIGACAVALGAFNAAERAIRRAGESITEQTYRAQLASLSADDLEGREPGTVGDVQRLPPSELERRFGAAVRPSLKLMHGEDTPPLDWWQPPQIPQASAELEHGLEALEPLLFVIKGLVDGLCARLEARGQALSRAELFVRYEKLPGLTHRTQAWDVAFPLPLREPKAVLNVLRLKLDAEGLAAPVREVALKLVHTVEQRPRALHLWSKESSALGALPTLIAELCAELGADRVGSLTVPERHAAMERSLLAPVGAETNPPVSPWVSLLYEAGEPLRCLGAEPWQGPTEGRLLVRRQGIEWWRHGFVDAWDSRAVWVPALGATAWVDLRPKAERAAWLRGWVEG